MFFVGQKELMLLLGYALACLILVSAIFVDWFVLTAVAVPDFTILPTYSKQFGVPYGKLTGNWWVWALGTAKDINPLSDPSGKYCMVGQHGPVWFLAGTAGGVLTRSCEIPASKVILIPILNGECTYAENKSLKTQADLDSCAKSVMDPATNLQLSVDGVPIQNLTKYRVHYCCFNVTIPANNIYGDPPGPTQGAADGVYVALAHLRPGPHTVAFSGLIPNPSVAATENFATGATYRILVTP